MKRLLVILGGVIALVLVLLLLLPMFFQGQIAARAKTAANESVTARVDWRDAGLSFFRNFPHLTLRLDDLTVANTGRFQGDTLAAVPQLGLVLDLGSVVGYALGGKPVVVRAVELERPRFSLIALEDGTANWDITDTTAADTGGKAMTVSLRDVEARDGAVDFDNRGAKLKASLRGVNQSLSGDFSQDQFTLKTRGTADTTSVSFAGMPYLSRVRMGLDADIAADRTKELYTLRSTRVSLNDLELGVTGSVRYIGELLGLDLAFKSPSENFRSILSLVPAVYAKDFDKVKTSGRFTVDGRVRGEYGDSAFPSFAINARVNDGAFQYPDLPLPGRDIRMGLSLINPGGSADSTVVNIQGFHMRMGANPVDGSLIVRTPVSDPNVDLRMKGRVDLADVRRTVKLEQVEQLTGIISGDAAVRARMSALDRKQYDRVAASGTIEVADLTMKGQQQLPLHIERASLRLAPNRANLTQFTGTVGRSDLQATGAIDNLISWTFRDDTLKGSATVRSNRFDLDEWRSEGGEKGDSGVIQVPANIDFTLNATVNQLSYGKLNMTGATGRVRIKDRRATLENFRMNALGGQLGVNGVYDTRDSTKPVFDVGFKMIKVNIPDAFKALTTVQMLAPVAKYASGLVSTDVRLNGGLGKNMMPLFSSLTGRGSFQSQNVALRNFPGMEKIVDVTKLQILNNPTMQALRTGFQIKDGRLLLQPFDVKIGGLTMTVAGSNGIDQSMEYNLGLKVPRSLLGGGANQALAGIVSKAGQAGINLGSAQAIPLDIQLTGKVTDPTVKVDLGSVTSSVTAGAQQAVTQAITQKVDSVALRAVAEAERQAAAIRQQAESLAARVKLTGYQQADALTAEAGDNPLAAAGAKIAADKLRQETDSKAQGIIDEAARRSDSLVADARKRLSP